MHTTTISLDTLTRLLERLTEAMIPAKAVMLESVKPQVLTTETKELVFNQRKQAQEAFIAAFERVNSLQFLHAWLTYQLKANSLESGITYLDSQLAWMEDSISLLSRFMGSIPSTAAVLSALAHAEEKLATLKVLGTSEALTSERAQWKNLRWDLPLSGHDEDFGRQYQVYIFGLKVRADELLSQRNELLVKTIIELKLPNQVSVDLLTEFGIACTLQEEPESGDTPSGTTDEPTPAQAEPVVA